MIFVDTNVVSETLRKSPDPRVRDWLIRFDPELALPTVVIGEISFGIQRIRADERAARLARGLEEWRMRFADRTFAFTDLAALAYGQIMGDAVRSGRPMSAPDGMIAAITLVNRGVLATRNVADFEAIPELQVTNPWEFH